LHHLHKLSVLTVHQRNRLAVSLPVEPEHCRHQRTIQPSLFVTYAHGSRGVRFSLPLYVYIETVA